MTFRKRLGVFVAGLLLALGVSAVAAAPASAAFGDCNISPRVCVWSSSTAWGNPSYYWTVSSGTGGYCVNFGVAINDLMKAMKITGGRSATMYQNAGCSGNPNAIVSTTGTAPTQITCYSSAWWPSCTTGLNQGSSIWIIR